MNGGVPGEAAIGYSPLRVLGLRATVYSARTAVTRIVAMGGDAVDAGTA